MLILIVGGAETEQLNNFLSHTVGLRTQAASMLKLPHSTASTAAPSPMQPMLSFRLP